MHTDTDLRRRRWFREERVSSCMLYAAFYVIQYTVNISFTNYVMAFGYPASLGASILSIAGMAGMIVQMLAASWIDRGRCRLTAQIYSASILLAIVALFFAKPRNTSSLVLYGFLGVMPCSCFWTLCDSWVLKLSKMHSDIDYAAARGWGSISYAIIALLFGIIVQVLGMERVGYILLLFLLVLAITARFVPDPIYDENVNREKGNELEALLLVLKDKQFRHFLVMYALSGLDRAIINYYLSILVLEKGGSNIAIGIVLFVTAGIEFIVFRHFTQYTQRFTTKVILVVGCIGFALKSILYALSLDTFHVLLVSLLQIVSFCLIVPGSMRFLSEHFQQKEIGKALSIQNFVNYLGNSLVAYPVAALLLDRHDVSFVFFIFGLFSFVGALYYWINAK